MTIQPLRPSPDTTLYSSRIISPHTQAPSLSLSLSHSSCSSSHASEISLILFTRVHSWHHQHLPFLACQPPSSFPSPCSFMSQKFPSSYLPDVISDRHQHLASLVWHRYIPTRVIPPPHQPPPSFPPPCPSSLTPRPSCKSLPHPSSLRYHKLYFYYSSPPQC